MGDDSNIHNRGQRSLKRLQLICWSCQAALATLHHAAPHPSGGCNSRVKQQPSVLGSRASIEANISTQLMGGQMCCMYWGGKEGRKQRGLFVAQGSSTASPSRAHRVARQISHRGSKRFCNSQDIRKRAGGSGGWQPKDLGNHGGLERQGLFCFCNASAFRQLGPSLLITALEKPFPLSVGSGSAPGCGCSASSEKRATAGALESPGPTAFPGHRTQSHPGSFP